MLLKKRIVVYSENMKDLLNIVKSLPCFVWARQQWEMIYPLVQFESKTQTDELSGFYVAGTLDSNLRNNPKWFDLFLDVQAGEVIVAEHAKEDLKITKVHKDVLKEILKDQDNNQLIKGLAIKTKEILGKLENFKEDGKYSIEKLKSYNLDSDLEYFLNNLAISENLLE